MISVVLKLVPEARDPGVLSEFGNSSQPIATLMRSMFAVRSRFTEDRLAQAAARGSPSICLFGAGLDTFPWRQPNFAKDMNIFAVDHPASLIQTNRKFRDDDFPDRRILFASNWTLNKSVSTNNWRPGLRSPRRRVSARRWV